MGASYCHPGTGSCLTDGCRCCDPTIKSHPAGLRQSGDFLPDAGLTPPHPTPPPPQPVQTCFETSSYLTSLLLNSTPKPKNRPPSPAAPKSRPLSPLVPAVASKTPSGKKTPPGTKTRPKRAQTPVRVQPQTPAVVSIDKDQELQQPPSQEDKKSECLSLPM